jgi:hypothetical protein
MKKFKLQEKKIEKVLKLYEEYKKFKILSESAVKMKKRPLTLDEHLENINPYYIRNEIIKYG